MDDDDVRDALLDLEHRGWTALCEGTGAEFYAAVMAADALMVLANGDVMDRDQVVAALAQSPPWAGYSIDDVRTVELGPDSVALVYTGTGRRDDAPPFVAAMTSVYVRDGGWRLALYQQTPRPG